MSGCLSHSLARIKDAVAGMQDNFLSYSQYVEICERFGENDPAAQADVAGILHALGLALYFGKDPRLHDTRVLNPGWVTGGVYAVIRAPSVAENHGQLSVDDMPQVLTEAERQGVIKSQDYPLETHPFILELMRAFQLCYASYEENYQSPSAQPSGLFGLGKLFSRQPGLEIEQVPAIRYLVPELLPEFEPEMPQKWESAPVRLRYRYEILPPALLARFIVRTHALSDGGAHWRHGVVLRHSDALALIRAETDRNELQVFALGEDSETRQVLVAMVRRELTSLHVEMRIQAVEELELTGEGEQWIGVRALREVEQPEASIQRLPVQPEGTAEVDVSSELDKLVPPEARAIDRDPEVAPPVVRIFVSYAREDERQLKRLDAILCRPRRTNPRSNGLARPASHRRPESGMPKFGGAWEEMDIFLFIASQTSLVRKYIIRSGTSDEQKNVVRQARSKLLR